ncbi:hypothetical protein [Serratia marcescens]|nr:hypothetical protein [Serratia marcescens]
MRRHKRQDEQAEDRPGLLRMWQQVGKTHSQESCHVGSHHD